MMASEGVGFVENQGHGGSPWEGVMELTKSAQDRNMDPLMWAMQLSSTLTSAGLSVPSPDLANFLVSHICWANNVPAAWKFLEKALTLRIVPPMLVLALLSTRVIPNRNRYPAAYRLYMELLKRYAFYLPSLLHGPNYPKIMESIDNVLHLTQMFGLQACEPGLLVVEFVFSIVWELLDASLDDEGLLEITPEKKSRWATRNQDMEIDNHDGIQLKTTENQEAMPKMNTVLAIELIGEFFRNKVSSRILYLAGRNMPGHWESFIQHLHLLTGKSTALRNSKNISPEALLELTSSTRRVLSRECKTSSQQMFHAVMVSGSLISSAGQCHGTSLSALWLPIDMFLEDTMDGSQVTATSAVETLTGLVKAIQAVNRTTWQDTFLGLWIAALRLVQRERDSSEAPVPRIDTCLCLLLSITPLAIVNIIEEEESSGGSESCHLTGSRKEKHPVGKRRKDLVASLQQLEDYEGLLTPPLSVSSLANQAAAKAMMFLSGLSVGSGYFDGISLNDMPMGCSGNLLHLIVEACIAREILDTSSYLWPGYVKGRTNQMPRSISGQMPGWSSLVKGSPLTPPLVSALGSIPASSLAEIEKVYEIAANGSNDEKISAATVLCGASLVRGWNIQEHTVLFITRLLSPPIPADYSGPASHLISYAPFLNVLLVGISPVDTIQIFSLHGLVPQLAGALMPICEVFGSCAPNVSWTLTTGEEISTHIVFSNAFTLLLKLWRFDQPPLEHVFGDVPPVGSHLTPEYLLLVRNLQLTSSENSPIGQSKSKRLSRLSSPSDREPIVMDSFPKVKQWYRQNQACIASTLSGLVPGTVHQIVDSLLTMMFRRINRVAQPMTPTASGSNSSSGTGIDDFSLRLKIPAWDILEAIPFMLDAALTACGHGTLSPRELATGLKDLADFFPASLATIASYFSAEVTRGVWKNACMNGSDWPSPAANLANVEQQIKKILAATGVDIPSLPVGGNSPATLPLPLAAYVSLTITYKLERSTDRFLNLVGPSLRNLAIGCPWPCMPIIVALWAQKVKRWNDFLVFSASQTVFHHNSDAVVQLLRACFTTTLGLNSSSISSNGGVGGLLGHGFGSHFYGGMDPVAPGILYLRVHRAVRNVMFMTEEIVSLLMQSVKDIVSSGLPAEKQEKLKKSKFSMKYGQVSLAAAMTRVKVAASLGASIVWITGGLSLVQSLIKETLPSWFISAQGSEANGGEPGGMVAMLGGYALAYFAVLSGTFGWGVDSSLGASKRRAKILGAHLEFLASAVDGKISLGCNKATWRAYVSGFVSLMVGCTPKWMNEVDVDVLKRLSWALKQWNEEELALALLGVSGVGAMGAAAELIIETGY
ncbi:mediator of RNA polymerase II transcription subunit 33A-like [Coffea eugenioides]|uniref:Mediator of RNA polymerase II transcription subunit 33A n=1 Tax=Coffea arabica TaxID=13443 RepID=A0A6P6V2C4_COFAR|nr:mediator of RNA polymerase II transcription subunit 33A-like [Coffea arabica]XP_027097224.1 mediator of RNA polymerase II transcription subunit 33A-like [Coffea arabica]XP_027151843.1 mediator of RNA polymerase II transcription subunit 33A-like [Coffea eugenioides]XP_027151845.1 mediator of RNA polymerase II transcription subunit 33A-like [Coffea eugenioides]